jgi:hypothetical protein
MRESLALARSQKATATSGQLNCTISFIGSISIPRTEEDHSPNGTIIKWVKKRTYTRLDRTPLSMYEELNSSTINRKKRKTHNQEPTKCEYS